MIANGVYYQFAIHERMPMDEEQKPRRTGRDSDQFVVRMPPGMRASLKDRAAINRRSLNSEVVARLEQSIREEQQQGVQQ